MQEPEEPRDGTFEKLAEAKEESLLGEIVSFLRENKKWWLIPFLVTLALVAMLAILGGTGVAPFIYTLF